MKPQRLLFLSLGMWGVSYVNQITGLSRPQPVGYPLKGEWERELKYKAMPVLNDRVYVHMLYSRRPRPNTDTHTDALEQTRQESSTKRRICLYKPTLGHQPCSRTDNRAPFSTCHQEACWSVCQPPTYTNTYTHVHGLWIYNISLIYLTDENLVDIV